ncbi:hypothetical protein TRICI_000170 [Trichomonascus ciferrii]|uniref:Uncharacterized protein n=1 Tax=Trichomonascus ciferrii TaxID=44093 RepID=A0A642VE72_9ASCO|nr:hypothetical protein TRICI_000170 [Trichomonascus ciferrii]
MSKNEITRSEPQAIPGAQSQQHHQAQPSAAVPQQQQQQPRRGSFFDWAFGSPTNTAAGAQPKRKPRAMSQTISHDEALNLSRAGSLSNGNGSSMKEIANQMNANASAAQQPQNAQPPPPQQRRARKNSYEGMGLVAAYSGGPSSF